MSYPNYNNTMIGDTFAGAPVTVTTSNNTSGGSLYWGMNGTSGGNGQVLTSNGTGSTIFADPNIKGASLSVKGDADFEGDVTIKGKSITDMFDKIEERLAILHPNPELEDKWENLRALRKAYVELEQEIIEKEKVWAILKK